MRKYDEENSACLLSHPVRGAWIEMLITAVFIKNIQSRTPSGVRGLKFLPSRHSTSSAVGRTPSGVRGLKCDLENLQNLERKSHPVRGAWIEIIIVSATHIATGVAPRQGCVD